MKTSDLLLVSKYMVSLALFFFPNKPFVHFLGFGLEFFFVTTVPQFQQEEGKKKHSSSHTAIECGFFLVVVVIGLGS
jgi:hypothetical protein